MVDSKRSDVFEDVRVEVDAPVGRAVERLYALTKLLRRECPWDRAQTAVTIVPHTLEEAYEVADAAHAAGDLPEDLGDLADELGDLLFQVCFLAMWCEEHDPQFDLASVARGIHAKLVRRHPHVFEPDDEAAAGVDTADDVRETWERVKRQREGRASTFDGIPATLPSLGRARKVQQRAAGVGFDFARALDALTKVEEEVAELRSELERAEHAGTLPSGEDAPPDAAVMHEVGDVLFAAVNVARLTRSDPEIALRLTVDRWVGRVERAIAIAEEEGVDFAALDLEGQDAYYERAKRS